jgi:hypothetical protein
MCQVKATVDVIMLNVYDDVDVGPLFSLVDLHVRVGDRLDLGPLRVLALVEDVPTPAMSTIRYNIQT